MTIFYSFTFTGQNTDGKRAAGSTGNFEEYDVQNGNDGCA